MREIKVIGTGRDNLTIRICEALKSKLEAIKSLDSRDLVFDRICLDVAQEFNCYLKLEETPVFISNELNIK